MKRALVMALLLLACDPQVPAGRSGLTVKLVVDTEDPAPQVVFFRIEPEIADADPWAVDAREGFPASRTVWLPMSGSVRVIAAGFECPDGCGSVNPWSDPPVATGRGEVELREGRVSSLTVVLEAMNCGNGTVDPGEDCDGSEGCSDSCSMDVTTLVEVPGTSQCGIVAFDEGDEPLVSWHDGSCGDGDSGCVITIMLDGDGTWVPVDSRESQAMGCSLATDHLGSIAWFSSTGPDGSAELMMLDPYPEGVSSNFGAVDTVRMGDPGLSSDGRTVFALAVDGESDTLELRWISDPEGVGSSVVMDLPVDEYVGSPSVMAVEHAGTLLIAGVWSLSSAGEPPSWMLARWSCSIGAGDCVPVALETEPIDLALEGVTGDDVSLVRSPGSEPMALVSSLDGDLLIHELPFPGMVSSPPYEEIRGVLGHSGTVVDLDSDQEFGLVVLTMVPVAGSDGCMADLTRVSGASTTGTLALGTWSEDVTLGCNGAMTIFEDRALVVFRGEAETSGDSVISWVLVTLTPPFQ